MNPQEEEVFIKDFVHYSLAYAGNSDNGKAVINKALKFFEQNPSEKFDFIVCAGNSGLALGSILSYLMDKPMWHMRNSNATRLTTLESEKKEVYRRELSCNFYGFREAGSVANPLGKRFLFIDDCIDQGTTFNRVNKAMEKQGAKCAYIFVGWHYAWNLTEDVKKLIK